MGENLFFNAILTQINEKMRNKGCLKTRYNHQI